MSTNRRIAKNTFLLFGRMIILMVISLIAVRYVRRGLGIEDYGIFNAVVGVVQILMCLNVVLASASQRFFSLAIGEKDFERLCFTFAASVRISRFLSVCAVLLLETIGLWFVINRMVYPAERFWPVMIIYQAAIFTLVNSLLQVPHLATVMSHERMNIFAWISLQDGTLKLLLALSLIWITPDCLTWYGVGLLLCSILSNVCYRVYCRRHFTECTTQATPTHDLYREMLRFSSWTLFGSIAGSAMIQGNMLLLNVYHGPYANAAFGIALQIYNAMLTLGNNIMTAIRPPLVKAYAENDHTYVNTLLTRSSQAALLLMFPTAAILLWLMPSILRLWLGDADPLTISLSRQILPTVMLIVSGIPLTSLIQATGRVKEYHSIVETFMILCLPLAWLMMFLGYAPEWGIRAMTICTAIAHLIRVERVTRFYPQVDLKIYTIQFLLPAGALLATLILLIEL